MDTPLVSVCTLHFLLCHSGEEDDDHEDDEDDGDEERGEKWKRKAPKHDNQVTLDAGQWSNTSVSE